MNSKITLCIFLQSLFFLSLILPIRSDLPVHCLKHQIVGSWKFELTEALEVGSIREPCGHDSPDNPKTSFTAMISTFKKEKTIELTLKDDDIVSGSGSTGSWTMVYDEGFEIRHDGLRLFAFSQYVKVDGSFKSKCSHTLTGWYHNYNTNEKGCMKGEKTDGNDDLTSNQEQSFVVQPKFIEKKSNEINNSLRKNKNEELINFSQISPDNANKIVNHLNKNIKSWTAAIHPNFQGLSLSELNKLAGRKKYKEENMKYEAYENDKIEKQMILPELIEFKSKDYENLPTNFSWKSKLQPPRAQQDCGSCYIFSTMAMLQARLKIKYDEHVTLSVQNTIDCNYYNQGCDGGYPFLVEKYANEFSIVPESCHPYKGVNGKCENSCDISKLKKVYKVKDYWFIGGSYGKANEKDMMLEIKKNGPIVVSFEPKYDFMYYKSGIYSSVSDDSWIKFGGKKPEWEKVDHSVLCYGWGEENGEKYWLLQNTWGDSWGENGDFRMKRGSDESHIESLAEAAEPYIVENFSNSLKDNFIALNEEGKVTNFLQFNKKRKL